MKKEVKQQSHDSQKTVKREDIVSLIDAGFVYFMFILFIVAVAMLIGSSWILWEIVNTQNIELAESSRMMIHAHEALVTLSGLCIVYFMARYIYGMITKKAKERKDAM